MRQLLKSFALLILCYLPASAFAGNFWQQVDAARAPRQLQIMRPTHFLVYTVDEAALKLLMWNLSTNPAEGMIVSLPLPDGSFRDFRVWQSPMMPNELAERYPQIKTFSGEALDNHAVTAKLEFTLYGFSAMIYDGDNTSFIDPFDNFRSGYYIVHYKRDEVREEKDRMKCSLLTEAENNATDEDPVVLHNTPKAALRTFNGHTLRTYRLALSANSFYCQAATGSSSPTIAEALSKMTITMNRVNGVYNREFAVQMNFVANEDTLIWPTATGSVNGADPFAATNSSGPACMGINQTTVTARIGTANYDLGHVFTTGGGGVSALGVVCNSTQKARSVTGQPTPVGDGFDIDYVAHEMGHEFGSQHTFNNNTDGSCNGNAVNTAAYEPGSGATIMDYAGICSSDNLQPHSDAYFSGSSLIQIQAKLAGSEDVCAVKTSTENKLVYLDPFSANYTIPYKTPFELIGPVAVDSSADTAITYGWAQWNRGDFGKKWNNTFTRGPIIRSYNPAYTPARIIPKLSVVLTGSTTTFGEKAPDTTRYLTFKMVVRNIREGKGCFLIPDDTVHIDAVTTGADNAYAGFKVTSQGTTGITYTGGDSKEVTWNVVGSNMPPVSATNVNIYMSLDGGNTWPYNLGMYPNTGSATITVPNPAATSTTVRFKVKGAGNVFFNINTRNVKVEHNPAIEVTGAGRQPVVSGLSVFPNPASSKINITTGTNAPATVVIYNAMGQTVTAERFAGNTNINVHAWPAGVYYARYTDAATGNTIIKPFVVQ